MINVKFSGADFTSESRNASKEAFTFLEPFDFWMVFRVWLLLVYYGKKQLYLLGDCEQVVEVQYSQSPARYAGGVGFR